MNAVVIIEDASWSIGRYTNEQLERMSEEQYEAARAEAQKDDDDR